MAQITVSAGSTTTIPIAVGQKVILTGQGIYRVSGLGGSQRPTVDESIDTTSTIGPFGDTCSVQVWGSGTGAIYEVVSPADVLDQNGRPASVSGAGKNLQIVDGGTAATSGWLLASSYPERFALELNVATGGSAASVQLDASDDGIVSASTIAVAALDVVSQQFITPPISVPNKYIRWTVVSAGTGNVRVARGV